MPITLSAVIVNYNTSGLLIETLTFLKKALADKSFAGSEIIVVDNGSSDDSLIEIKRNFPEVKLIRNKVNRGFAAGNNQGIKTSRGRFILLLNSDTRPTQDFLKGLLTELENDPDMGVAGPRLLNIDGSLQPSAGFFPSPLKVFFWLFFLDDLPFLWPVLKPYHLNDPAFYKRRREVGWLTGACLLVKKEAIEKGGYLDEQIFMYGEEVEWCLRIKRQGYRIVFCPDSVVYHHKGSSGAGKNSGIIEEFKSVIYLYRKYYPGFLPVLKLMLKSGALLRLLLFGIITRDAARYKLYVQAYRLAG